MVADQAAIVSSRAPSREPRARAARYDPRSGRVIVELTNGCTSAFRCSWQGLETRIAEQLSQVDVLGTGSGLPWEALDADLSIPSLLADLFGIRGDRQLTR